MPHFYQTFSIGTSFQKRPIIAHTWEVDDKEKELFRVLNWGGIHGGIEWESTIGAQYFVDDLLANIATDPVYQNVSIAVVPGVNIDGHFNGTQVNAQGWDCSIDGIARFTPETRALFAFAHKWKPNLCLEGHNNHAWDLGWNTYMFNNDIRHNCDIMFHKEDVPWFKHNMSWDELRELIKFLNTKYTPYKYDLFWHHRDDGEVLYNDDVELARNHSFMAARYNALTLLCEGISPQDVEEFSNETEEFRAEQAAQSYNKLMKGTIDWLKDHLQYVSKKVTVTPPGTRINLNYEKTFELEQINLRSDVRDSNSNTPRDLVSKSYNYHFQPQNNTIIMPMGYAWPNTDTYAVLNFYMQSLYFYDLNLGNSAIDKFDIETIHIDDATESIRYDDPVTKSKAWQHPPKDVSTTLVDSTMTFDDDWVIILCDQQGGDLIPRLLEPTAEVDSLTRYYEELGLLVQPDTDYIVKRLIKRIA